MATRPIAVTNTSPVIALAGVGQLSLLGALFESLIVPIEVWAELVDKPGASEPAAVMSLPNLLFLPTALSPTPTSPDLPEALHAGERAAISLALTQGAWAILDDATARRVARRLGVHVAGTLGVLVEGKRTGRVREIRPLIERMIGNGYRLAPDLVSEVLRAAGER